MNAISFVIVTSLGISLIKQAIENLFFDNDEEEVLTTLGKFIFVSIGLSGLVMIVFSFMQYLAYFGMLFIVVVAVAVIGLCIMWLLSDTGNTKQRTF